MSRQLTFPMIISYCMLENCDLDEIVIWEIQILCNRNRLQNSLHIIFL